MPFENQIVWITGASSGIGEALVHAFAKRNAKIILSARRKEELERVRKESGLTEYRSLILPLDLTNPKSIEKAVKIVKEEMSHVHILINNGGVSQRSPARETPIANSRKIFETNFFGTIDLTRQVLPLMPRRSQIVTITSVTGKIGTPGRSSYSASKHALHGYFDALRAELFDDDIGVTLVLPGYIKTNVSMNAIVTDGSAQGTTDDTIASGILPEVLAEKIVKAVLNRKREIVVAAFRERLGIFFSKVAPGILAKIIRKAKVA